MVQSPGQIVRDPVSKKAITKSKNGLEEWLKWYSTCLPSIKALSSNHSDEGGDGHP
jgi:hypothetical protein